MIIAEIGMNHMGDPAYADEYVKALKYARPDGLTFQVRESEYYAKQGVGKSTMLSDDYYRSAAEETHGDRMRFSEAYPEITLENASHGYLSGLATNFHPTLRKPSGMSFGVTLCDLQKLEFFEEIGADFYKVLSKDIGNKELVAGLLETEKPVYVSTGMSGEDEITEFLVGLGLIPPNLSLIHTQLSYDDADTNLRAIGRLRERFGVPVAFGLHSTDVNVLYASLGFAPSALFFYVKGSRQIVHKDEAHAIPLAQCEAVIAQVRRLEKMMGDGVKKKMENRIARKN